MKEREAPAWPVEMLVAEFRSPSVKCSGAVAVTPFGKDGCWCNRMFCCELVMKFVGKGAVDCHAVESRSSVASVASIWLEVAVKEASSVKEGTKPASGENP